MSSLCSRIGFFAAVCIDAGRYYPAGSVNRASAPAWRFGAGPLREIAVAAQPDAEVGNQAFGGGAQQGRELVLVTVARHRCAQRSAAHGCRVKIDLADPLREL